MQTNSQRLGYSIVLLPLLILCNSANVRGHESHPMGFLELPWHTEEISRVTSSLMDFQSGGLVLSWSGRGDVVTLNEKNCLKGAYFLFDVDDQWAFDIDETIEVSMTLPSNSGILVSYDHAVTTPVLQKVDKKTGQTSVTVPLQRAGFSNRLFAGSDFALAAKGSLYPYNPEEELEVTLCDIQLQREVRSTAAPTEMGQITLTIRHDNDAALTPARVGIFDSDGRMPLPSKTAVPIRRYNEKIRQVPIITTREFWPAPGGYAFYVNGTYRASLAPGEYDLVIMQGPENHIVRRKFRVEAGQETQVSASLKAWETPSDDGWYSGDVHVHMSRERQDNSEISSMMRAENLNVTNVLQMANIVRTHFPQYAFGKAGEYQDQNYALVSGQESPRSGHRGHTIGLHGDQYYEPSPFFLYHEVANSIQEKGGLFGYAHLLGDAFHVRRGLAMDAPLGLVDFVEILQFGVLGTDIYYDLLNLGFRIAPAAGSDFPYIDMPGAGRNYVRIKGDFSTDAWFDGLKAGRTFVSNGPLLTLSANEKSMGDILRVNAGESVILHATAKLNPDFDTLARLEFISEGEVIATSSRLSDAGNLSLEHTLNLQNGTWVAVRAYGQGIATAHSAPLYIEVGDSPHTSSSSKVNELVDKYLSILDETLVSDPQPREDLEHWETGDEISRQWHAQLNALQQHVNKARKALIDLRISAHGGSVQQ